MLATIKQFFQDQIQKGVADTSEDAHAIDVATAALMVEIMRADFDISDVERQTIRDLLQGHLQLSADELDDLFMLAEQEVVDSVSLYQFTSLVDQELEYSAKVRVIEMLWRVVYADDRMDKYEEYLMRKIADLLHISHRDFIQTKHRVMPD
jgi:uncharacterized tellurite resistance protein B-like protein